MKRIRIIGLCLVAVFAMSAIAAASASAQPTYKLCGTAAKVGKKYTGKYNSKTCSKTEENAKGEGKYELKEAAEASSKFTGKLGKTTFYIRSEGVKVECSKGKDTGELFAHYSEPEVAYLYEIKLEKCTATIEATKEKLACTLPITTTEHTTALGTLPGGKGEVGTVLYGEEPWKINCSGLEYNVTGEVIGAVSGVAKFKFTVNEPKHEQLYNEIEEVPGFHGPQELKAAGGGVGLVTEATQKFAKGVVIVG